jgi:histidyl-tRNA synthetase
MFRHERPQRGRYRQFHQVGVEALGFPGPDVDAEVILMARALWRELGLTDLRLEINSLGQASERAAHRAALIAHFEAHADQLDADAQRRLHTNPLRILDTKHPQMQPIVEAAPRLMDFLGDASMRHLDGLMAALRAAGQDFVVNPRLVRGMDYYNLTVFEWVTDRLGSQGTVCGGGRYDPLIEMLGGKPAPAVGWGLGMERVLELTKECGLAPPIEGLDVYGVVPEAASMPQAVHVAELLRQADVSVILHPLGAEGAAGMKSQFKKADASGARYAIIFGANELARGEVALKPLRDAQAPQLSLKLDELPRWAPMCRAKTSNAN